MRIILLAKLSPEFGASRQLIKCSRCWKPIKLFWKVFSHNAFGATKISTHIIPPLSIARYSFIQLSVLGQCGMNEIAQTSKHQQEDLNKNKHNFDPQMRLHIHIRVFINTMQMIQVNTKIVHKTKRKGPVTPISSVAVTPYTRHRLDCGSVPRIQDID